MRLKSCFIVVVAFFAGGGLFAQTFNQNNGQWNVAANWSTGSVPSGTGTDVTIAANVNVSGGTYTIGNVTQVNNNTSITIASDGVLNLGSSTLYNPPTSTTKKSATFANAGVLNVAGTLRIYGDLIVSNTLTFNITGNVIVYGDIIMNNGGDITVSGSGTLQVNGNLTGGNGTHLATSGGAAIAVGGSIGLGGGNSSISGPAGSISAGGGCSCTGSGSGCNVNGSGSCGNTVLPIELLFFSAEFVNGKVDLKWATASELNFDYFSVERSSGGMVFSEIGQVKGNGTSRERHNYSFTDINPLVGKSYYRLKSIDYDRHTEDSEIVFINTTGRKKVFLYPNPIVEGQLFVDLNFTSESDVNAFITDLTGSQLMRFTVNSSNNLLLLDLKPGSYLLKVTAENFSSVSRFVVK